MKSLRWYIAILLCVLPSLLSRSQAERPKPAFTLAIEDDKTLPDDYPVGYHRLLLKYTNVSDAPEDAQFIDFERLNMIVLCDGAPAKETALMQQEEKYRDDLASGQAIGRAEMPRELKPGESVTVPLYISDYFDTSKPGTYTITVNEETFPHDLAKSVTVWSNTITIVVPSSNHPPDDDE